MSIKHLRSEMRPQNVFGLIWIQIVCKGHQLSSQFAPGGKEVYEYSMCPCVSYCQKDASFPRQDSNYWYYEIGMTYPETVQTTCRPKQKCVCFG